jgi:hypothetical protein
MNLSIQDLFQFFADPASSDHDNETILINILIPTFSLFLESPHPLYFAFVFNFLLFRFMVFKNWVILAILISKFIRDIAFIGRIIDEKLQFLIVIFFNNFFAKLLNLLFSQVLDIFVKIIIINIFRSIFEEFIFNVLIKFFPHCENKNWIRCSWNIFKFSIMGKI